MAKKNLGSGYKLKKLYMYEASEAKPPAERDGVDIGVANGLNLTKFLNELFYANFDLGMCDRELDDAMRKEFPAREKFQTISSYRSYFNQGVHGHGVVSPKTGAFEKLEGEYRLTAFPDPEKEAAREAKAAEKAAAKKEAKTKVPAPKAKAKAKAKK